MMEKDFWKHKTLEALSPEEWEAICDGCAKCCLIKLRQNETQQVCFTNVVCRYLDLETCRCSDYLHRHENVPDCLYLTVQLAREADWLPRTCSYRLLAEGKDLPWWHPLQTGMPASTRQAGGSVYGKVVSEAEVDDNDLEDMVVDWFD
jgi:uncharacterized cysteine cluster protein YcgN (CxxCxxCC family)